MEKITLYIPCYNVEKYIARCLEGVLRQTCPVSEILIIDDCSRDRTREIVAQYPVRVIRHETNKGLAAARNTAFQYAQHSLVAALDADCVPEPDWLERLLPFFQDKQVVAAGGRLVESVLDSRADCWRKVNMTQDWGEDQIFDPLFMFGNNLVARKSVVIEIGGYNEVLRTNGEDADLSQRIKDQGYHTVYEPRAVVKHLRHDNLYSLINTLWRYRIFGSRRFLDKVTFFMMLKSIYHHTIDTWGVVKKDWVSHHYEFLGLDLLMFLYMPYFDLKLVWNRLNQARRNTLVK